MSTFASPCVTPVPECARHILAERFKTRLCYNYIRTGSCPYESRCMFAHGEPELRTTEQNMDDGLYTEEAIKSYQRAARLVARQMESSVYSPYFGQEVEYDGSYDGTHNYDYYVREDPSKFAAPYVADSNFSTGSNYDGALSSEELSASSHTPSPVLSEVGDEEILERSVPTPRRGVRWVTSSTYCNNPYSA